MRDLSFNFLLAPQALAHAPPLALRLIELSRGRQFSGFTYLGYWQLHIFVFTFPNVAFVDVTGLGFYFNFILGSFLCLATYFVLDRLLLLTDSISQRGQFFGVPLTRSI